jgi:hypothetical protein
MSSGGGGCRPRPLPLDYDENSELFRLARSVLGRHARAPDIHARVARRLCEGELTPVLDVGCGDGEFGQASVRGRLARAGQLARDACARAAAHRRGRCHASPLRERVLRIGGAALRPLPSRGPADRAHRGASRAARLRPRRRSGSQPHRLARACPRALADAADVRRRVRSRRSRRHLRRRGGGAMGRSAPRAADPNRRARVPRRQDRRSGAGHLGGQRHRVPLVVTKRGALLFARKP